MKSLNGTEKITVPEKKGTAFSVWRLGFNLFFKPLMRLINIFLSLTILVMSLPLILLITIIVKLDSPGPAIFRQKRIGINRRNKNWNKNLFSADKRHSFEKGNGDRRCNDLGGKPFTFYKFRTMVKNAKELYPKLYAYNYNKEDIKKIHFKLNDDQRLTRCGQWLDRKSVV